MQLLKPHRHHVLCVFLAQHLDSQLGVFGLTTAASVNFDRFALYCLVCLSRLAASRMRIKFIILAALQVDFATPIVVRQSFNHIHNAVVTTTGNRVRDSKIEFIHIKTGKKHNRRQQTSCIHLYPDTSFSSGIHVDGYVRDYRVWYERGM